MKRFVVLSVFCAVMACAVIALFNTLATVQSVVPGATVSPSLVMGLLLMVAAMSGSTTLAILRRF
jgi:hypothetical protein